MATGYLAAGVHSTQITKNEVEKHRYDELDDMLANVGTTFLGLTVGCARCHDHKFDAIPRARLLPDARRRSPRPCARRSSSTWTRRSTRRRRPRSTRSTCRSRTRSRSSRRSKLPAKFAAWEKERAGKPLAADAWVLPRLGREQVRGRRDADRAARRQRTAVRQEPDHGNAHLRADHQPRQHQVAAPRSAGAPVVREGRAGPRRERQLRAIRHSRPGRSGRARRDAAAGAREARQPARDLRAEGLAASRARSTTAPRPRGRSTRSSGRITRRRSRSRSRSGSSAARSSP